MVDIGRAIRHPGDALLQASHQLARRRMADRASALSRDLLSAWDLEAFAARFRSYWEPLAGVRPAKYLDLDTWVREAALRSLALDLFDDGQRKRVLDIGCGCGYFLAVCRYMGHDVLGIDIDEEPLYNEMVDFLGLPRVIHRVSPDDPLPRLNGSFDVVSAFMVCFNFRPDGSTWDEAEWARLLRAWVRVLAPKGKVVIKFNGDPLTGRLYPPALRPLLDQMPDARVRYFGDHLVISRIDARSPGIEAALGA